MTITSFVPFANLTACMVVLPFTVTLNLYSPRKPRALHRPPASLTPEALVHHLPNTRFLNAAPLNLMLQSLRYRAAPDSQC